MSAFPNVKLGRQRVTTVTNPASTGYVSSIRQQTNAIASQIIALTKGLQKGAPTALKYGMQPIFDESQRLVPVQTGKLKRSGFLEIEYGYSAGARVSIGYARGGQPHYAQLVHERVDIPHRGETQAKFLQEAVDRNIHKVRPRILKFIRERTGLK